MLTNKQKRTGKPNYEVYLHLHLDKIKRIVDYWLNNPLAQTHNNGRYHVINYKLSTFYLYESGTGLESVSIRKSTMNEVYDI